MRFHYVDYLEILSQPSICSATWLLSNWLQSLDNLKFFLMIFTSIEPFNKFTGIDSVSMESHDQPHWDWDTTQTLAGGSSGDSCSQNVWGAYSQTQYISFAPSVWSLNLHADHHKQNLCSSLIILGS